HRTHRPIHAGRFRLPWLPRPPPIIWIPHTHMITAVAGSRLSLDQIEISKCGWSICGCPQGGVASPVMSNTSLDRLDRFVEQHLIPDYTRGDRRRENPAYTRMKVRIAYTRKHGDREGLRRLRRERRTIPSGDPHDPGYRRLRYVRYCDDFLLGFAGPKQEAEEIRDRIRRFLRDELALELSESKTLITHAVTQAARFLGYEIRTQMANDRLTRGQRAANSQLALFVPRDVIRQRCALYMRKGKAETRRLLTRDEEYSTVPQVGSE